MNVHSSRYNETELTSTLTSKGQVTVPAEIRRLLGFKPKAKVAFLRNGDGVYLSTPRYTLKTIKGIAQKLNRKYSEKEMRDIAIESHVEKFKSS